MLPQDLVSHEDAVTWKRFPHYWFFVRVSGGFPSKGPVMRGFGVFFDVCQQKLLNKQSSARWFNMRRHLNVKKRQSIWLAIILYIYCVLFFAINMSLYWINACSCACIVLNSVRHIWNRNGLRHLLLLSHYKTMWNYDTVKWVGVYNARVYSTFISPVPDLVVI